MMVAVLVRFIIHPQLRMFTMHFLPAIVLPSQSAHKEFLFVTKGPLELSSRMVLEPEVSQV